MDSLWLHRWAVLSAVSTLLLTAVGGMAPGAPWHRPAAMMVGALALVLAIWISRVDPRRWVRVLGWSAVTAVVLQGGVGSLAARVQAPVAAAITHAAIAHAMLAVMSALALALSPWWNRTAPAAGAPDPLARWAALATVLLALQGALGAAVRYSAVDVLPHVAGAVAATLAATWSAGRILIAALDQPPLRRAALWTLSFTFSQVFLGLGAVLSRAGGPAWFSPFHIAAGALALAASTILTLCAWHSLSSPALAERAAA